MPGSYPARFYLAAVTYGLIGMALGIYMAATHNHGQLVTHAHLLLVGWVSMFLFGAFYHLHPGVSARIVSMHWWIANFGVVILTAGLFVIYGGNPQGGEPLATVGSLLTIAGMVIFAYNVVRATRAGATEKLSAGTAV